MTKSTITRARLETLANAEYCKSNPGAWLLGLKEVNELARMALAAMDSEPVRTLSVRHMSYSVKKIGNQFGFVHSDAAMTIAEGDYPLYRHAQPVPVVPDDVLNALQDVARIRADLNNLDGDCRGVGSCLWEAEERLLEIVAQRSAMLSGGKS